MSPGYEGSIINKIMISIIIKEIFSHPESYQISEFQVDTPSKILYLDENSLVIST